MTATLYNDDFRNIIKNIQSKTIDLILTDIPYGEVNRKSAGLRNLNKGAADIVDFDINEMMSEFCRVCRGSMYIFCGTMQVSEITKFLRQQGYSTRLGGIEKTNPSPMNGDKIWLSGFECCVYGKLPKATFNEHCRNTIWRAPCERGKIHPTQKPLSVFEYLVKTSSNPQDMVLDPFMGSGTTGVACKNLNRQFIGIERDKDFFEAAKNRINTNDLF